MDNKNNICMESEEFARYFLYEYFEKRNVALCISMLHEKVTWFGTKKEEICNNYESAMRLFEEANIRDAHFTIVEQWYQPMPIDDESCLVYGELKIIVDELNSSLKNIHPRFSMVCKRDKDGIKLYHVHFSMPKEMKAEEQLHKETKMLKEKTIELEALANDIYGGVELCKYDETYTILYVSDGFTALTGYTRDEIYKLLHLSHWGLVYEEDRPYIEYQMKKQLETSSRFSVTYRIVRKDGRIVWVLDNGTLVDSRTGGKNIQSILMDITVQKEQEEELRLSEKRYEIAMRLSEIEMFQYNVITKELNLFDEAAKMYGIPTIIKNGPETMVEIGAIMPNSAEAYLDAYKKIHEGIPFAKCHINTKDTKGIVRDYEIHLTAVYDNNHKPTHAIGVRKDIAHMMKLEKEREFGKTLVSGKYFVCEADLSNDLIVELSEYWIQKFGVVEKQQFSTTINEIIDSVVDPIFKCMLHNKLSEAYIREEFEKGNSLISFDYKRRNTDGIYEWYEATINSIKDVRTGILRMRFYQMNINERKSKEEQAKEAQHLYQTMLAKSIVAYEVNISSDIAVKGCEEWDKLFGIEKSESYSAMISAFSQKGMYVSDGIEFEKTFNRGHVIDEFRAGERELSCQYRKIQGGEDYRWVVCSLHLYEDPDTGDIKGFSYVEDIHKQKEEELELKYNAEHDAMTDMLNKTTTSRKITEFVGAPDAKYMQHALLMIDIDYFKYINDSFGHVLGDEVLEEIAGKIKETFREGDIIGRVGGDEFCVLMKNINSSAIAKAKASELCTKLFQTYKVGDISATISASVGIAIYPEHGSTYEELYLHSDKNLYIAKERGRNQYII